MKPLAFVLLVLVGSMILTSMPSQIYADPQLNSLLRIANQARDNIKIRISQLTTVPDEIASLYAQGSTETDALVQSVAQEDVSSSRLHFLSAMRLFKTISDKLSQIDDPYIPPSPPSPTCIDRVKNAINKMEKTVERTKTIATQKNTNIDFTESDKLIQIARENCEVGNIPGVYKTLEQLKQIILRIIKDLKDLKPVPTHTVNELSNTPPPNASQAPDDVSRDNERDSKLERIKTKIQTLEEQLNSLSDKASGNDIASQWIKRAFSLIEKAKGELDKSPEKAMRTLNEVDKIMGMIQRITQ